MIDLLRNLLTGKIAALMEQQEASIDSRIWQVVALIPPGKVATYGDVARQAGLPVIATGIFFAGRPARASRIRGRLLQ
jgi:O6-methylguanine-DNA--protein-cysteine methyltransferase